MRFWSLPGLVSYAEAREFQKALVDQRAADEIPDTILFLEHEPVITRGRGLQFTGEIRARHMPMPIQLPPGVAFAESERGGDLTYHGPGQLVVYPIVKLDGKGWAPHHDVTGFLRRFEQIFIDELASMGLTADARSGAAGVWVGDKKVASIGIAVRKWVTYHGIAINVVNDLSPFHIFSPCGFASEVMTRLSDLVPDFEKDGWRERLEKGIAGRVEVGAFVERRLDL
jgi:lipoyl(octanoyl) transferase